MAEGKRDFLKKCMTKKVIEEILRVLTCAIVIFILMEIVWPGIVLAYININWVLIFWLLNVILLLFIKNKRDHNG